MVNSSYRAVEAVRRARYQRPPQRPKRHEEIVRYRRPKRDSRRSR